MTIYSNTMETVKNTVKIFTKLKFVKSDMTDSMVSFVSQNPKTGRINGVRQDSQFLKKVCVVDRSLAGDILANVLYDCTLVPMFEKNGYVVIAAKPVQFTATVETCYVKNNIYNVEVKFGNKTLRFDPFNGRKDSVRDVREFKKVLEKRIDISDIFQVMRDFDTAANKILALLDHDKYEQARKIK